MTPGELRALAEQQITTDLVTAARAAGIGKDAAYAAYHAGTLPFPAFQVGRAIKVPTAPLVRLLLGDDPTTQETGPAPTDPATITNHPAEDDFNERTPGLRAIRGEFRDTAACR